MYDFDAVKAKNECVKWIRDWFEENGKGCNAVIGISGGKDSTVVAALCAEALGPERVIGVLLPDGVQPDISDSRELIEFLRIPGVELNISAAKDAMISGLEHINFLRNYFNRLRPITTQQARENLPPRLRMSALYLAAQCWNGRVSNNCNLSENWIGYSTIYGDMAGDFSPISCFTVTEVIEIGRIMGIPEKFLVKPPADGLCGQTDEEKIKFTYAVLDRYLRTGEIEDLKAKERIDAMHERNRFKHNPMAAFSYGTVKNSIMESVNGVEQNYGVIYKPKKAILVIKKDGTKEAFNVQKVIVAIKKSAYRALTEFTDEEKRHICQTVIDRVNEMGKDEIPISIMHNIVESALEDVKPIVAKSYRDYRNYKQDFVRMMDDVYKKSQSIMYLGDKENSNTNSALVATKRSLTLNQLNKELYQKFFMTTEEIQACRDGYIYVHDMSARRDTMNCCLFNMEEVLKGGFEMGNIWYNEPKTLDTAFDVIGDVTLSAASQQYGGFTIPEVDTILEPYAEKSYKKYLDKYLDMGISVEKAEETAYADVVKEMEQGFQGWEYKFNTVGSSRGDYPFITISLGLGTGRFARLASITALNVRKNGQGKKGNKKPVLFPKITFLYDENLHGPGKPLEDIFNAGIMCSRKAMYPDYLSLTGEGYIPSIYKKYEKVISLMGCRASLSPWYERGGMKPADEEDKPVFTGRFNIGAVSLHLPMILAKSRQEGKDFYEVLDYYLNMIRQLHIRTYAYLGEMRASTNPIGYCEGGFYGGHLGLHDKIKPLLKPMTASFGITALNELQMLYNRKSLVEDGAFALEVMEYINKKVNEFKEEDGNLYAVYGTPAENLCGLQVSQFRAKYGIIEGVSDREYVSNSFHCHVAEDITPIEKQDLEYRFWDLFNGGKIQYVRYPIDYNIEALKTLIRRAMDMGFYEGVNLSLAYCDDCGHQELEMDVCPKCGSRNLTKINRMNGYLSYSRVHGDTRLNAAKMAEIAERKSM